MRQLSTRERIIEEVTGYTSGPIFNSLRSIYRIGNVVIVNGVANFADTTGNTFYIFLSGLPRCKKPVMISVPNEYGQTGTATFYINSGESAIRGKCSHANNYYYFQLVYATDQ